MKNLITGCSVVIILLASCSPATEKKADKATSTEIKRDTVPVEDTISKPDIPVDFSTLVPIDLLDAKSTNVYEKYGIEFSGNCYSCDLASLSITKDKVIWTNVCDEKDTFKIDNFSFTTKGNRTILKTTGRTYILTQIDKAPVYELTVEGQKLELNNKRISRYFTTEKALPLFKEHDCGDFEG
ncbi:hypothetical protein IQ37_17860 [Chryseobacterium piperi]|uniref:Lipoprotein n=1 Tax=Chryseobacterium piperi TaxID=558152 RepID=A0A086AIJ4_9FLAO|nr:hypothetical protein [Chryseobacterium piperi]ASW73721.1 hypothetical protein CJF12_05065 [Chryseobacterium piperi]KFF16508.1 hypothetical protein IQ37_17860 [Chryseobacterium piperi]